MTLRDVQEEDLAVFFDHQRQPDANRMAALAPRIWPAFLDHWHERILGRPGVAAKTVVGDGVVVGNVVSWTQDNRRLIGYWIGQEHWGRGIATRALLEFVEKSELARPLHAHVAVHNIASIRVLQKCGFQASGEPVMGRDGVEELVMVLSGV